VGENHPHHRSPAAIALPLLTVIARTNSNPKIFPQCRMGDT
jgi:hypothetical protein